MNMRLLLPVLSISLLTGCLVAPNPHGGLSVIPLLPFVVELDDDDCYVQGGTTYYYRGDRWYYSTSRRGPRMELPRSRWPREVRHRGGGRRRW